MSTVVVAFVAAACGDDGGDGAVFDPPPGTTVRTVSVGGEDRDYVLHVPEAVAGDQEAVVPLVLGLHDAGGTARGFAETAGLFALADREGFVVALPEDPAADDVDLAEAVVADVVDRAPVGPVDVIGQGRGGELALRLACEHADLFDGVAAVGAELTTSPCRPTRPVPLVLIQGADDVHHPRADLARTMVLWASALDCEQARRAHRPGVRTITWEGCRGGVLARSVLVLGTGHAWPTGPRDGFDASSAIWEALYASGG